MMARNMFVISFLAVGAWGCSARIGPDVRQVSTVVLPDPSVSSMSQGRVLFGRGEYALAIEEFRKAIRETPDSPEGYNALASSYDMIGRFDLASRNYELALARAPDEGRIYRNMARSLKMQGRVGEAEALLAEWDAVKNRAPAAEQSASAVAVTPAVAVTAQAVPLAQTAAPTPEPLVVAAQVAPVAQAPDIASQAPSIATQVLRTGQRIVVALDPPKRDPVVETPSQTNKPVPPAPAAVAIRSVVIKLDAPTPVRTAAISAIRIMNAGARKGAAQRMQTLLARSGTPSRIADADRRLAQSWIVYPNYARADAMALKRRLPIAVRTVADNRVRRVTLLLGQDAASFRAKIGRSARRT